MPAPHAVDLPGDTVAGPDAGWSAAPPLAVASDSAPSQALPPRRPVTAAIVPAAILPAESVPTASVPTGASPERSLAPRGTANRAPGGRIPVGLAGPAGFGRAANGRPTSSALRNLVGDGTGTGAGPETGAAYGAPTAAADNGGLNGNGATVASLPDGDTSRPPTSAGRYSGTSSPSSLPEALRPFAPGAPNVLMDVAAMVGSPHWKPGDDDVMPTDGRHGSRRPRLRDHLPW